MIFGTWVTYCVYIWWSMNPNVTGFYRAYEYIPPEQSLVSLPEDRVGHINFFCPEIK